MRKISMADALVILMVVALIMLGISNISWCNKARDLETQLVNEKKSYTDLSVQKASEATESEKRINTLKDKIDSLNSEIERLESELKTLHTENEHMRLQLDEYEQPTTEEVEEPSVESSLEPVVESATIIKDDHSTMTEIDDNNPTSNEATMEFWCTCDMTAYIPTGNPCANGNYPQAGYTVACNTLPFGTKIYIEGWGYRVVEDRGGMPGNGIDLFVNSYDEAVNIGRQSVNVYICK